MGQLRVKVCLWGRTKLAIPYGYGSIPMKIPFLGGWTSIYQLFWCSPGVQGFDTLPYSLWMKPHSTAVFMFTRGPGLHRLDKKIARPLSWWGWAEPVEPVSSNLLTSRSTSKSDTNKRLQFANLNMTHRNSWWLPIDSMVIFHRFLLMFTRG